MILRHAVISLTDSTSFMINTNKQTKRLKSGTSRSQVEHSTTGPVGTVGMLRKFGSFHNAQTSMHARTVKLMHLQHTYAK